MGNTSLARSLFALPPDKHESVRVKGFVTMRPLGDSPQRTVAQMRNDANLRKLQRYYGQRYQLRLYVYTAENLSPKESFMGGYPSASPYLIISNGYSPVNTYTSRDEYKANDLNPGFYRIFELPASLPENHRLEVAVWHRNSFSPDELIGRAHIDVESRLLLGQGAGQREELVLFSPKSRAAQGKVYARLDVLSESEARKKKPDEMHPPVPTEFELRMVIWSTRNVKFPDLVDKDIDVNQTMEVWSNYEAEEDGDTKKTTDVAWAASAGMADWNYRLKWRMSVPAKVPRIKLVV